MAICENCKKYPLEYREVNKAITKEGREVVLCDDCFKLLLKGSLNFKDTLKEKLNKREG